VNSKRRLLLAAALVALTGVRAVSFGAALFAASPLVISCARQYSTSSATSRSQRSWAAR
jgi:hypothetical protein